MGVPRLAGSGFIRTFKRVSVKDNRAVLGGVKMSVDGDVIMNRYKSKED